MKSSRKLHKKGFELSINFVVTIILAIAILGLGIILLRTFVGGTLDIQERLDTETDAQLESLLDSGLPVALPLNRISVKRGESHIFGLGVRNTGPTADFRVLIGISVAIDEANENIISEVDTGQWLRYDRASFPLDKNDKQKFSIRVEPPKDATAGTYVFKVDVTSAGQDYGSKKFWVTVP